MPLRPSRMGRVGVVGAPVAKAAVVTAAVRPGPSPVAKAAVVGAAVTPGRSPVAKTAVVAAAVTAGPASLLISSATMRSPETDDAVERRVNGPS